MATYDDLMAKAKQMSSQNPQKAGAVEEAAIDAEVVPASQYDTLFAKAQGVQSESKNKKEQEALQRELGETEEGTSLLSLLDAGSSIVSSVFAAPVSGLTGIGAGLATKAGNMITQGTPFGDPVENAAGAVENVREGLTYMPSTKAGQQHLKDLGDSFLGDIGQAVENTSEFLGDTTLDITGSPALATAAHTLPEALLEAGPLKAFGAAKKAGRVAKEAAAAPQKLKELSNPATYRSGHLANIMAKGDEIVLDPIGQKLLDNGIEPTVVSTLTNADSSTKRVMRNMLTADEGKMKNPVVRGSSSVLGGQVQHQLKAIQSRIGRLGSDLDGLVKGQEGKTLLPSSEIKATLDSTLAQHGIKPKVRGAETLGKTFSASSRFAGDMAKPTQNKLLKIIGDVESKLKGDNVTVASLHAAKKQLDGAYEALGNTKDIDQKARKVVADMRSSINSALVEALPGSYGKVNQELSSLLAARSPFDAAIKKAGGIDQSALNGILSAQARRSAGGSEGSAVIAQNLDNLQLAYKKNGGMETVDYGALLDWQDQLDSHFLLSDDALLKSAPDSSQISNSLASAGLSASMGNTFGAGHSVAGAGAAWRLGKRPAKMVEKRRQTRALMHSALARAK